MLGITARLLSRPYCHPTRFLRKFTVPHDDKLLRHEALRTVGSARYKSKVAGDNDSGHIEAGENEGILFVDSTYYRCS